MPKFVLRILDSHQNPLSEIALEAPNSSRALTVAHEQKVSGTAELWQGTSRICTLQRQPVGRSEIWRVEAA